MRGDPAWRTSISACRNLRLYLMSLRRHWRGINEPVRPGATFSAISSPSAAPILRRISPGIMACARYHCGYARKSRSFQTSNAGWNTGSSFFEIIPFSGVATSTISCCLCTPSIGLSDMMAFIFSSYITNHATPSRVVESANVYGGGDERNAEPLIYCELIIGVITRQAHLDDTGVINGTVAQRPDHVAAACSAAQFLPGTYAHRFIVAGVSGLVTTSGSASGTAHQPGSDRATIHDFRISLSLPVVAGCDHRHQRVQCLILPAALPLKRPCLEKIIILLLFLCSCRGLPRLSKQ